jgi:hypothetical protein
MSAVTSPVVPLAARPLAYPSPPHLGGFTPPSTLARSADVLSVIDFSATKVLVFPWRDDVIESTGHDPRSAYVERFWLGVLGPSATWFVRSLAWGLESCPDGFALSLTDMARALGLGEKLGRHSPFIKAVHRSCQFELTSFDNSHPSGAVMLRARQKMPWLSRRMAMALPDALRAEHRMWIENATLTQVAHRHERHLLAVSTTREAAGTTVIDGHQPASNGPEVTAG